MTSQFAQRERRQHSLHWLPCRLQFLPFSSATRRWRVFCNSESFRKDLLVLPPWFHKPRIRDRLGSIVPFVVTKRERGLAFLPQADHEFFEPARVPITI